MKKFVLFFLLLSGILFAQESTDKIVYLDSLGKITSRDNHVYYRITKDYDLDKSEYIIEEYYKSGILKKTGPSETKDRISYRKTWISYYENGIKSEVISYEKGRPSGIVFQWYDDGSLKLTGEYIQDQEDLTSNLKVQQFWNSEKKQTVIDGNGDYEENEEFSVSSGKVKNGWKDGEWKGRNPSLKYTFTEFYKDHKLVSGKSTDSLNVESEYTKVFLPPRPKKGLEHFYKYISKNFRIPNENVSGKIILEFIINKDGSIGDIKILKSINEKFDNEAIRVISEYPEWGVGELRGIKVRTSYSIPIIIRASE